MKSRKGKVGSIVTSKREEQKLLEIELGFSTILLFLSVRFP